MTSTLFLSTESDEKHSAERSDLIQNARTHLLSGIASLPTEILSQIFVHVCQNTDLNAVLKGSQVPAARIASVCRFWRNICLAESCFWSSFAFDVGRPFEFFESWSVDSSMMLRVLKLFLQQSKSTKLNVSARFCLNDPCFEEFARHAERWAHVDLDVVLLTRDFNLLRNRLTALKTLSLRASHRQNYPNNHVVDAFENAPALCGLVLHGTMPSLPIPHNQIIDLTSDQPDASGMRLAQQCPNLRSLTLTPPASHDTHAHVTHKLLSSLTISLSADNYIADIGILARFTTPNLRSLRIQSSSWSTLFCWPQKDFLAFVNRSQPFSLYELVLDRVCTDMSGEQLIECLSVLPTLEKLKLVESPEQYLFTNQVCEALTRRPGDAGTSSFRLCPLLKTLNLAESCRFDPENVTRMVESRSTYVVTHEGCVLADLKSLTLSAYSWVSDFEPQLKARIKFLERSGLCLYIAESLYPTSP